MTRDKRTENKIKECKEKLDKVKIYDLGEFRNLDSHEKKGVVQYGTR